MSQRSHVLGSDFLKLNGNFRRELCHAYCMLWLRLGKSTNQQWLHTPACDSCGTLRKTKNGFKDNIENVSKIHIFIHITLGLHSVKCIVAFYEPVLGPLMSSFDVSIKCLLFWQFFLNMLCISSLFHYDLPLCVWSVRFCSKKMFSYISDT